MSAAAQYHMFKDFALQSGQSLPEARLVYQTFGKLNAARDNAILFPTWYSSKHEANAWLIGEGKPLDPRKWFIILPNLFANGYSASPSNMPEGWNRAQFPAVTVYDNVRAQRLLVQEILGIERLALYLGRSMGAMAAFHYASLYPEAVKAALMLTGASRCSPHNYVFLASLKAALTADAAWMGGDYESQPKAGMAAFGRIYAGWIYSSEWYRRGEPGATDPAGVERFLQTTWDRAFLNRDANDLLAQLETWQNGNVAANRTFGGDQAKALGAITARSIVMPSRSDMYFPPEDSAQEVELMPNAELRVIPSCHGHRAGTAASSPEDVAFVGTAIEDLLR